MELQGFIEELQAKIVAAHILILKMGYPGIAQRAKTCRMFLVLESSFKPLSIHSPGTDHDPRNAEAGDRPYQLRSCSFTV